MMFFYITVDYEFAPKDIYPHKYNHCIYIIIKI